MAERVKKKDRVLALRAAGRSYKQICEELNCCSGYVSATIQRAKHGGCRPTDYDHAERWSAKLSAERRAAR
jgi:hypothetical protein